MNPLQEIQINVQRRCFFGRSATGLGSLGLASLLNPALFAADASAPARNLIGGLHDLPHHSPRIKRVIYLFMSGGPAQMDLFDHKPQLQKRFGQEVPRSVYPDERKTTMTSAQASFPVAPSQFRFPQCGRSGIRMTEALPHLASVADDLCVIRSMHTDAINHDPAITFQQTGAQVPGRPSIGAWLSYGLGSENANSRACRQRTCRVLVPGAGLGRHSATPHNSP